MLRPTAFALAAALLPATAFAADSDAVTALDAVEVTATRIPESADRVPGSITIISGEELRARGAHDLRTALSLVSGVDAPPGGDAGPASAVVSFWGLHEFDAFLLVVDGVPWGGAFNPSIPTLDLNDVERIEVLKGAAPVVYGATAFVGVIQVIHYPAGRAADQAEVAYGSYGSLRGSGSLALPAIGGWRQSLALGGERERYSVTREQINNGKLLYRGAGDVAGGTLRLDADATAQRAAPNSPIPGDPDGANNGDGLNPAVGVDANFNPADARIDEHRLHFVLGYSRPTVLGQWDSTASYAHSVIRDVRGFLRPETDAAANDDGGNADYQNQARGILDTYLESHLAKSFGHGLELVYGADLLYGSGRQTSLNGAYCAGGAAPPFDCPADEAGAVPPATTTRPVDEVNRVDDRRAFFGQFVQADWKPDARWDLNAGLRLNETHERNLSSGSVVTGGAAVFQSLERTRLSGSVGASYLAWSSGADQAVVYADYRNTFKPAALDFGPDVPTPNILDPESARSYEGGIKGHLLDGRLDYELEAFLLHFNNLVVEGGSNAAGQPQLVNAGSELFRGLEWESRYRLWHDLQLAASASYHSARFASYDVADADSPTGRDDFSGRQQALSPRTLASAGLLYAPPRGLQASAVAGFVGRRYLDPANTVSTPGYVSLDAGLGYRWRRYSLGLNGYNLTDARKPTTASEFGESSYYVLPGRRIYGTLGVSFR